MAKSIPAIVTPEVLQWARNLDQFSIEEISQKVKVSNEKILAWEQGEEYPTLNQAKKLAKQYRVPFAYFYLPSIPQKTKRLEKVDYRTFGNCRPDEISREFRWFLRDIEDRRDTMIELYKESELPIHHFSDKLPINITPEQFSNHLRNLLGLTAEKQIRFRKADVALSYCISKLEENDFLIFEAAKISPREMRGVSIAYECFPIIALNRKDEQSARLFTLCHELVHILTRTSGICNDMEQEASQNDIELYCNKVTGLTLVPTKDLKANKNILLIRQYGFDDTYVEAIARDFAVSREVILHRLWSIGLIEKSKYFETLRRYSDEYIAYKRKKAKRGFLPPALDKGTQVGKLYAKTVLFAYHADRITPRETSGYLLGLHVKHFGAVERWCY